MEKPPTSELTELKIDASAADSLFAGIDEVKSLGFPTADTTHTETAPVYGPAINPADPCGLLHAASQGDLGEGWQTFRQLDVASTNDPRQTLHETVAIFPDKPAAQAEFHRLTEAFTKCQAQSPGAYSFGMRNAITLSWADNTGATHLYTTGNVVYGVTSSGAADNAEVAGQVAYQLKTNIIDPA
ncbi:sensor domain-containing protein [Mycobacteroides saopaulense]|uniref:Sensor domain-containing protein n=1 Tax=Mycobacteroides saopaulense TaxID=1578165 RepID=A0ABX3BRX9_9MYCO|nr:sensor domain-containing protein [Mycobacteroides saopaulense]OHT82419.1 sensor domain-containing protein [Mycobacteroides saopaulense]OHU01803.1 sensor domain-containing protein [Mycobacteroides saopaulense]